jgi:hypothetical protein
VYAPLRADTGGRYHLMLGVGPGAAPLLRVLAELKSAAPQALATTRVLLAPGTPQPGTPQPGTSQLGTSQLDDTRPYAPQPNAPQSDPPQPSTQQPSAPQPGAAQRSEPQPGWALPDSDGRSRPGEAFRHLGLVAVQLFDDDAALLDTFRIVLDESLMGTRLYVAGPESFIGLAMQIALEFNLSKDEIRAEEVGTLARRVHCVHCRGTTLNVRTNIVRCSGCDRWLLVRDHYSRRLAAYMGVMVDAEVPGELPPLRELYP